MEGYSLALIPEAGQEALYFAGRRINFGNKKR